MTFHGKYRGDSIDILAITPTRSPDGHADPARTCLGGRRRCLSRPVDLPTTGSSATIWTALLARPIVDRREARRAAKVLHHAHDVPLWVTLAPLVFALCRHRGWRTIVLHRQAGLPAAHLRRASPALYTLLRQQVLLRRVQRRGLRPAGARDSAAFLWKAATARSSTGLAANGIAAARRLDWPASLGALQTGYLYHYAFAMLIGVVVLVTLYFMLR